MVKISKGCLAPNVPSEDVYVTKTHPLSVKVISDGEFLHLFVSELMDFEGVEYVRLEEKYLYNLMFDKHYEVNIGNMKFLSHHPNHNNGNIRLAEGTEFNPENRSKKVYADNDGNYFKKTTLKELLKEKPKNINDKNFLSSSLSFEETVTETITN